MPKYLNLLEIYNISKEKPRNGKDFVNIYVPINFRLALDFLCGFIQ